MEKELEISIDLPDGGKYVVNSNNVESFFEKFSKRYSEIVNQKTKEESRNNFEFSTEAVLAIYRKSCLQSLKDACEVTADTSSVTKFLKHIFLDGIGYGKGAYYEDNYKNSITVSQYFELLLKLLPDSNRIKDIKARNAEIKRRNEVRLYFLAVLNELIKAGWKERTPFDKASVNKFEDIIVNYEVN